MKYFKFICFLILVCAYFVTTIPFYPFLFIFPMWARDFLTMQISLYARCLLKVMGVKATFTNFQVTEKYQNYLIVSNHLSYMDVLILASRLPSCFVTSTDIKAAPFLGQLSQLAGCLFVNRKDKRNIREEISELREALSFGLNVTVFPEATSTNGSEVLRFKRPLFESSVATGKPILPLTINYRSLSGNPVSINNRDKVCWYGDMDFFPHFMGLLEQSEVRVEIVVSQPFLPELLPTLDLAMKSQQLVSQSFSPLNMPIA